jgi:hypothetical protein
MGLPDGACTKSNRIDMVNRPPHYTFGTIEVIDVIEAWRLPFHIANAVKYVARCDKKGKKLEDLKKTKWYVDRYLSYHKKNLWMPRGTSWIAQNEDLYITTVLDDWKLEGPVRQILVCLFFCDWVEVDRLLITYIRELELKEA